MLTGIPDGDLYVLLGDFNAHIGSRELAQEGARGRGHGAVKLMMLGKSCLAFSPHIKLQPATRGLRRRAFTKPPGSIPSPRAGAVSTTW